MRRLFLGMISVVCAAVLCGCSQLNQVENLAYVLLLGVDLTESEEIEVSVQFPKIAGGQNISGSGGGEAQSDMLLYSARGKNFLEALTQLNWAVPRRMSLAQIELIVVSEKLATDARFMEVMDSMMDTTRLYTAARLTICQGSAKDFIQAEKALIGGHISSELKSMFESYTESGYIPDVTFADVYYKTMSYYSDPLTIYSASAPNDTQAASLIAPDSITESSVEMQQANRFLGAAVLRDGTMVGTLNAREQICCNLLRGSQQSFIFSLDENTLYLAAIGSPKIQIDVHEEPMVIDIGMRFSLLPDNETTEIDGLEESLEQSLLDTIDACKSIDAEPFQFAEHAVRNFATIHDWLAFDWRRHFRESQIHIDVSVKLENT